MGIKGIYKEIGDGERVSLCKIATEHIERHPNRPFRLAIDVSIWQFQIQAARGGSNPAIRTMFYRLVRMLGHGIEPIFVFDGPKKPEFKRNKRSGRGDGARVSDAMAKSLIQHFGFVFHNAPGEAEAECALLQRNRIVDAVLSEDVDTIMFGCGKTFRNWSSEGSTSKTPTHVTVYDAAKIAAGHSGLDREGMVLIALMSGGDYIPEGIPGCGIKVACEAARAGFGREVCRLKRSDTEGLNAWRQKLMDELKSNESGFFRTKHKALVVPADFPSLEVLRYYTHPVVSNEVALEKLSEKLLTQRSISTDALREFTRKTFDWNYKQGAVKFIKVLAPSMLVQRLVKRFEAPNPHGDDLDAKQDSEASIVKKIASRRTHASTGETPELRVSFIPAKIVGIDLSLETEEPPTSSGRSGLALNSDDDFEEEAGEGKKATSKKPFDPSEADLTWVPESIVEMGVPLMAGDFKDQQRSKHTTKDQKAAKPKGTRAKKSTTTTGFGPMDQFMNKVVKLPSSSAPVPATKPVSSQTLLPRVLQKTSSQTSSPEPIDLDYDLDLPRLSRVTKPATIPAKKPTAAVAKQNTQPKKASQAKAGAASGINPWTIAKSALTPSKPPAAVPTTTKPPSFSNSPIIISSSPVVVPAKTSSPLKSLGRVTPTKRASAASSSGSTSSDEPPSPTPGPRTRCSLSVAKETLESPTQTQQPSRRARQFKRTKSGAEEDPEALEPVKTPSTQPSSIQTKLFQTELKPLRPPAKAKPAVAPKTQSNPLLVPLPGIKGCMPVAKRATASVPPTKPACRNPIIILDSSSDDDDDNGELPDLLKKGRELSKPALKPAPLPSTTTQPRAVVETHPQKTPSTLPLRLPARNRSPPARSLPPQNLDTCLCRFDPLWKGARRALLSWKRV
ncbi:hypothetical protein B0T18DRAFT_352960 [Schizothecium vesticola]|uniref:XPG-I domain-containing protein n=1 Tax=Schizothecium vesticola TaxID=314040 RepID=A0AA40JZB5_9PEZI|nr:hypothetical protein B0T18DRAFT_352960 [Schizothecium vesticola]